MRCTVSNGHRGILACKWLLVQQPSPPVPVRHDPCKSTQGSPKDRQTATKRPPKTVKWALKPQRLNLPPAANHGAPTLLRHTSPHPDWPRTPDTCSSRPARCNQVRSQIAHFLGSSGTSGTSSLCPFHPSCPMAFRSTRVRPLPGG